ncbi:hypothetical protein L1987_29141 [Smallanthus sonchifolius]|uniref:Uncharacterized protein n=1 Tax=Smallanthus sonchifolius TaxID=185202 RepID=A0ACB9I0M7_9ASTR|nr:hypothetical protein L1987_29141 [Smallanthus sonchifolius]
MADYTNILVLLTIILSSATITRCSWISRGGPPLVRVGDYIPLGDDLMDIPSPEKDEIVTGPNDDFDLEEAGYVAQGPDDKFMIRGKRSIADMPAANGKEFTLQGKDTVSEDTFIIQGKVYCDLCRIQIQTKISYPLANTKVTLVCHKAENDEESYRVEGSSDDKGKYILNVVGDHAEEICEIIVSESPDPNCPELMDDENNVRVSLTNKHGIKGKGRYANPLGFMVTNADPRCKEALDELGFTVI